jgi:hypothetical protein
VQNLALTATEVSFEAQHADADQRHLIFDRAA